MKRWIDDLDYRGSIERLVSQPTVNIQGLVGGYTGPGGKTILPHARRAKIDLRLVPNMTREDCVAKLKAHLAKKGFGDIEVNVSGGYDPTETAEDSQVIQAQLAVFKAVGAIPATLSSAQRRFVAGLGVHRPAAEDSGGPVRPRLWPGRACAGRVLRDRERDAESGGAERSRRWVLSTSSTRSRR